MLADRRAASTASLATFSIRLCICVLSPFSVLGCYDRLRAWSTVELLWLFSLSDGSGRVAFIRGETFLPENSIAGSLCL